MRPTDVTDDAVWHAGTATFAALARSFNMDRSALHAELHRRGWRKAGHSGVIYQAPCAGCGKPTKCGPADPGGLDGRRLCRQCRAGAPAQEPEWRVHYRRERQKREALIEGLKAGTVPIEPWRAPRPSLRTLRRAG